MPDAVFRNARIVLGDEVVPGTLSVRGGRIDAYDSGGGAHGEDLEGDYLIPGLVELHTDHFEKHYRPRPGVTWNAEAALQAHDAQIAGAGITTVFDAVRIGSDPEIGDLTDDVAAQVGAIEAAQGQNRLRAEHFVHLRCELPTADCFRHFEAHCARPVVKLASVMDHTPGARQYTTLEHYVAYYQKKLRLSDAEMARFIRDRQAERDRYSDANRAAILRLGREIGLAFASHDATLAHVEEAWRRRRHAGSDHDGGGPSALPRASPCLGAPNRARRSHNGNIRYRPARRRARVPPPTTPPAPMLAPSGRACQGIRCRGDRTGRNPARQPGSRDRSDRRGQAR